MCGILGSIDFPISEEILDSLRHRGPDDYGISRFYVDKGIVHLAQRRLAILDLSPAGHQPMISKDGKSAIIFNGEVYNHRELRTRLLGHYQFSGHSDTETLLYYLQEFGIESVKDFNGIFSLAFYHADSKELYLVRDPFGVKPLYYWTGANGRILFSSELRAIRSLIQEEILDKQALAVLLRLRYNPSPDTLFKGFKKIRPGHFLRFDLSANRLQCSSKKFSERLLHKGIRKTKKNYLDEYGERLEAAVRRQMLSDVEIGLFLSGGVDSAVVAALAQRECAQPLKAFTIGFKGSTDEDEIEAAQHTARHLGLEHHFTRISFEDFLNQIKVCTAIVEEPLATTSMIPMYYLAGLAASHVKVVLTGQGADEPLGGYTRYRGELIHQWVPGPLRPWVPWLISWTGTQKERFIRGGNLFKSHDEPSRFLAAYEVFTPDEIRRLVGVDEKLALTHIEYVHASLQGAAEAEPVERMMAIDTQLNLADDLLNYTDKITMHFSMECRVPMLDLELVKFVESLPRNRKLNLKKGKIIHKQYAERILPSAIIHRPKRAFQSPTEKWFRQEADQIDDILTGTDSQFSSIFNREAIRATLKAHQAGQNKEKQIYLLLSIYYWMETLSLRKEQVNPLVQ